MNFLQRKFTLIQPVPSQQISVTDMKELRGFRTTPSLTLESGKYNNYAAFLRSYSSYVVDSIRLHDFNVLFSITLSCKTQNV